MALKFNKAKTTATVTATATASAPPGRCAADHCPLPGSIHRGTDGYCIYHDQSGMRSGETAWQVSEWLRGNMELIREVHRCTTNDFAIPPDRLPADYRQRPITQADVKQLLTPMLDWRRYPDLVPKPGEEHYHWGPRAFRWVENQLAITRRAIQARQPPPRAAVIPPHPQQQPRSSELNEAMRTLADKMRAS